VSEILRDAGDSSWKTLFRIGGFALLVEGVAYLVIIATATMIGAGPANNMTYLNALGAHSVAANVSYSVTAIADFALIPAALALYLALRDISRSWMLLATAILLTYVAIDISTFVLTAFALVALASLPQSAGIVAAEHFGLATVPLSQFWGWVYPPIAFLIIVLVMRAGHLNRWTRLAGVATVIASTLGGFGFLFPVAYLLNFQFLALALYALFMFGLGAMLLRWDKQHVSVVTSQRASPGTTPYAKVSR
jgi:hypothetical protein